MHFKAFKGLGKPKEKPGGGLSAQQMALMEDKMNGQARSLEELAQRINGLVSGSTGEQGQKPHGPLGELSIAPDDSSRDELTEAIPEPENESHEQVKLVEVNMAKPAAATAALTPSPAAATAAPAPSPAPAPAPAPAAPPGTAPSVEGLNNLFRDEEEEENPLANLIRTLPDYTAHEIVEDLNEIKRIIKEWQRE